MSETYTTYGVGPDKHADELHALRDEVARLRQHMEQAYAYIKDHRHGKAQAMLFAGLEKYKQAAITPQVGGKSCAHPRTQWYSGQYEKTLECLDCRVELDERKL